MRHTWKVLLLVAVCVAVAWTATGQIDRERNLFTTAEPLAVGSQILEPGTYRIQVVKLSYNRNIVQVTDREGMKIFAQALATPHPVKVDEAIPESLFSYYPATDTKPKALRTWFAPGTPHGQDIVYPKGRAEEMAATIHEPVVAMPEETKEAEFKSVPLVTVTPEKTEQPYVAPAPAPAPMVAENLPKTASREPLIGLAGLLALGGALAVRTLSRR